VSNDPYRIGRAAGLQWAGRIVEGTEFEGVTEFGPVAAQSLETIEWRGYTVGVPPLAIQLEVSRQRKSFDRVEKIERALLLIELCFLVD